MTLLKLCALLAALACLGATAATAQDGPPSTPPLAPAITEIEVDWLEGKRGKPSRLRLKAQVVPRGAEVEKVVFRYRKKAFGARKGKRWMYTRVVKPRGGDRRGKRIRVKVRACTATACATRTERVKAR